MPKLHSPYSRNKIRIVHAYGNWLCRLLPRKLRSLVTLNASSFSLSLIHVTRHPCLLYICNKVIWYIWWILFIFFHHSYLKAIRRLLTENLFFWWWNLFNLIIFLKNLFFSRFLWKCTIFCFFLGRFLSPCYVFNWAGLSAWLGAFFLDAGIMDHLVHAEKWAKG